MSDLTDHTQPAPSQIARPWLEFRSALVLSLASVLTGWFMPEFYDWTGADQSRDAPIVRWIALAMLCFDALAIGLLIWVHVVSTAPTRPKLTGYQVKLWHIMVVTLIVAGMLAFGKQASKQTSDFLAFASAIPSVLVLLCGAWWVRQHASMRWLLAGLLSCQLAPFLWICRDGNFWQGGLIGISQILALPTIMPSLLLGSLLRQHYDGLIWLGNLMSSCELAVGIWLISRGTKRALSYILVTLTLSIFGSFILHALVRM
ncbi:MAG: hypothetical protein IT423_16545 [Pirellulaceae bacterium]|nr:hypothetical protein [Pirellulaceae bacterium]